MAYIIVKECFEMISIATAITLTEWSRRTLWRRISDGSLARVDDNDASDKTRIPLEAIKPHICIPLDQQDFDLIRDADAGHAEAQTDLALIFLSNAKPEGAVYWLELAAKQDYADAMHWLSRCYLDGTGVPKDENLGLMWLAKAASRGHVISQGQMQAMRDKFTEAF